MSRARVTRLSRTSGIIDFDRNKGRSASTTSVAGGCRHEGEFATVGVREWAGASRLVSESELIQPHLDEPSQQGLRHRFVDRKLQCALGPLVVSELPCQFG